MKTFTDFVEEIFERAEEEDERDKPDRNVVMQARKAVNMGSKDITFHDGKTHNVSRAHAQKFLHKHTSATRDNKLSIQNHAQQNHKNFMSHTEEVEVDFDEGTGSRVCQQCENGKTESGSACKPCGGTGYDMSSAKPTKPEMAKEGKAYGPTGVSYAVPKGHKDEVDPKTREKYPERQKPESETKSEANIVEISADRLSSYMNKASDASKYKNMSTKKVDNRYTGVSTAHDKMASAGRMGTTAQRFSKAKVPATEEVKVIDKTGSYISKKETKVGKTYAEQMANMMTNLIIKTNVKVEEAKGTHVTKDGNTAKKGLWYNIAQKKKRGGEPAEVGDADRPSAADMKRSQ
tara:strand:+ start:1490 stop:2533 length:1044 start_codon:yes stop_codon:yes gene_type:complete